MKPIFILIFCWAFLCTSAQKLTNTELKNFRLREDSLKKHSYKIVNGEDAALRFRSDSNFTRILVRALVQKNSFYFPFDSLKSISRLYSPDSTFRIFTWQVVKDDSYCRQRGFIQKKTTDGSLNFFH